MHQHDSARKTLSFECKLVAVAQFVQKLFNVEGPLPDPKWPKWPPGSLYMTYSFFSKRATVMIWLRKDLVSYTWTLVRTGEKVWVLWIFTWRPAGQVVASVLQLSFKWLNLLILTLFYFSFTQFICDGRTDQQTDRRTDGWTDRDTLLEMREKHLKRKRG